jgi:hypothetical protein
MLTERDVIMRLVRQLAELLAAVMRLRREGRRDEALKQIDAITGRLTGMDAGALCLFGEAPLAGLPASSRRRWRACFANALGSFGMSVASPRLARPSERPGCSCAAHALRAERGQLDCRRA